MLNTKKQSEEIIERDLFDISILLKGIHAVIEILSGIFTFLISPDLIFRILNTITVGELTESPIDTFTQYLLNIAHGFSVGTKQFIAFYLLSHGIVNLILVIGLFKKKMWAYYASFVALTVFAVYQLYRYAYNHSTWLIILTMFDFMVIWLIWREYRRIKKFMDVVDAESW